MENNQLKFDIESFIDRSETGVSDLLEAVQEICLEKEEHIRINYYQDSFLADLWHKKFKILRECSAKIYKQTEKD